jgi:hypothetical protein
MRRFKLVRVMMGSGWPSGHVAINEYITYPDHVGGREMCLNTDTENPNELISEIDGMIAELEAIKREVPSRFASWKRQADQGR